MDYPEELQVEKVQEMVSYPKVEEAVSFPKLAVEVLNKKGYEIQGTVVTLPEAENPQEYQRTSPNFTEELMGLKKGFLEKNKSFSLSVVNATTEEVIAKDGNSACKIALNFANAYSQGGGVGFYFDSTEFIYVTDSAKAQEESLSQRTTLMVSLSKLPHSLRRHEHLGLRNTYQTPLQSTEMAYTSENRLFAIPGDVFHTSHYLQEPVSVIFVTSAARDYRREDIKEFHADSKAYKDAKQRIETHLLAAASRAIDFKKKNPDKQVELILGAFGCGAFAPKENTNEYRRMIAEIYKNLLWENDHLTGVFDRVVFALPILGDRLGDRTSKDKSFQNNQIFSKVLIED